MNSIAKELKIDVGVKNDQLDLFFFVVGSQNLCWLTYPNKMLIYVVYDIYFDINIDKHR